MSPATEHTGPRAPAGDTRQLTGVEEALQVLARKGSWLAPISPAKEGCAALVWTAGHSSPLGAVPRKLLDLLIRDGLVVAAPDTTRWSLGAQGRTALRRAISRRGEPEAVDQVRPVAAVPASVAAAPAPAPTVNPCESPLGWLRRRTDKHGKPLLGDAQFQAGERLRADLFFAELSPRITTNWSAAPGSSSRGSAGFALDQSDRAIAAGERVNRALAAVGPELSGILVDVCGHLKGLEDVEDARGWSKRSAKVVLELALTALARHYGYISMPAPEPKGPARVRHWGSDDYRPSAEAWLAPDAQPPS